MSEILVELSDSAADDVGTRGIALHGTRWAHHCWP